MVMCSQDTGGKFVDESCEAHLLVYDVTIPDGATVNVVFEVLAATRPSQVGKTFSEKLSGEKASGKLLNLALATRIITPAEREAARNGPFDLADDRILMMKSRQLCGKVTMQRKQRQNPATGQWRMTPPTLAASPISTSTVTTSPAIRPATSPRASSSWR